MKLPSRRPNVNKLTKITTGTSTGDLSKLKTRHKGSLIGAINEIAKKAGTGTGGGGGSVSWASITGKPSSFTPSAHTHAISEVIGLAAALASLSGTFDIDDGTPSVSPSFVLNDGAL